MKIGYARVSTQDKNLKLQLDALKAAGCEQIYKEKVSAVSIEQVELQQFTGGIFRRLFFFLLNKTDIVLDFCYPTEAFIVLLNAQPTIFRSTKSSIAVR
jgi:hypothetical protein